MQDDKLDKTAGSKEQDSAPTSQINGTSSQEALGAGLPQQTAEGQGQPPAQHLDQSPKKRKAVLYGLLAFVLLLAAGMGVYFGFLKKTSTDASTGSVAGQGDTSSQKALCFVRLNHLVCTDAAGNNRVRYDFQGLKPGDIVRTYVVSQKHDVSVAIIENANAYKVVLGDGALKMARELSLPDGMQPNAPSVSIDGKSVLLELSKDLPNDGIDRQIYRYNIAGNKFTALTSTALNTMPIETKDGHILFQRYDQAPGSNWAPYIMNSDGSGVRALPGIQGADFKVDGISYDVASDTVYGIAMGNAKNKGAIRYGKVSDLLAGKPASELQSEISSSSAVITPLDAGHFLVSGMGDSASIRSFSTGAETGSIANYGDMVGWLDTASLKMSADQQENKYERIEGLDAAPVDLQTFLKQRFDTLDQQCGNGGTDPGSPQAAVIVHQVVRDTYASADEGCDGGSVHFYVKSAAGWQDAFSTQETPDCERVNTYKFTKEIIPTCYEYTGSVGKEVPNQNP